MTKRPTRPAAAAAAKVVGPRVIDFASFPPDLPAEERRSRLVAMARTVLEYHGRDPDRPETWPAWDAAPHGWAGGPRRH